jgi:hypothetical protein
MSQAQEDQHYLEHTIRGANNFYTVIGGCGRHEAFSEALEDLRIRSFPRFDATGTISCLDVDLSFTAQDSVQTMSQRFRDELDEIGRMYGDNV